MKNPAIVTAACLAFLLPCLSTGCKTNKAARAQQRAERVQPDMSINEVYRLMGKPRETFAAVYAWEYTVSGRGQATNRTYRVEFQERGGKWVVRDARWR